ncbi:FMN-binding negative transcriptional regulator [Paucibacter sp. APW11]|uniref:FMN-binding negative transcriptional regulator n=1 Tax=Roseateles aquae TaxID=3077235 RepID=A0ABU3P981_9BURK|nr:FMN-binding negative transcriptional regulator [Paucibacter sp. APW11]MDT8999129.1 FMN-binding negative transcriptional regulator [Paucibacter sp. APW11]
MYTPRHFRVDDFALARQLIQERPLALLLGPDAEGQIQLSHLPLTLIEAADGALALEGHMARGNPQWRWLSAQPAVQAVFTGPDGYVSPRHYDSELNVPTWNFLAVQVRGRIELLEDEAATEAVLKRLIADHEPGYAAHWDRLPQDFQQQLLRAIVGFRIRVEHWECKAKLSQNRAAGERASLLAELDQQTGRGQELALWMRRLGL